MNIKALKRSIAAGMMAFILSVTSLATPIFAKDVTYTLSEAAMVIHGLGLIDSVAEDIMTANITRGEMAQIIYNIVTMGEEASSDFNSSKWEEDFFGELSQALKVPQISQKNEFSDVMENNEFYAAVKYVSSRGILVGNAGSFNIDEGVTYAEASQTLLRFMGYTEDFLANTDCISYVAKQGFALAKNENDTLKYDEFLQMLYKCFDTKLPQMQTYKSDGSYIVSFDKDKTFLSTILGLNIIKGRLTDNGISSLISTSQIGEDDVLINGVLLHTDEEHSYIKSFLGYDISCYYTNNTHDNEGEAVFAAKIAQAKYQEFAVGDFKAITKDSISYTDSNDKIKNVNLELGYKLIVNGMAEETVTDACFKFDFGTVSVLSSRSSSGNDLVIVEGYDSTFVTNTDRSDNAIYIKNVPSKADAKIDLDNYDFVTITDEENNPKSLYEINTGSVLDISKNDNIIRIKIVNALKESILITGMNSEDNTIQTAEKEYNICKSYYSAFDKIEPVIGGGYDAYVNSAGYIVWLEIPVKSTEWIVVYCRSLYMDEIEQTYHMRVYTESGEHITYEFADKVTCYDENDNMTRQKINELYTSLENYNGLLRIKLKDDLIKQVEIPLSSREKVTTNDRLFVAGTANERFCNGVSFGGDIFWNSSTVIMSVPDDLSYIEGYDILNVTNTFRNTTMHTFTAYGTNYKSMLCNYFITSKQATKTFTADTPAMVVSRVASVWDEEEGESLYEITGLLTNAANPSTIRIRESDNLINQVKSPFRDMFNDTYTISKGDVIRYMNDSNGFVNYLEMVFDADAVVDTGATNSIGKSGVKGWLCGSDGFAPISGQAAVKPPIPYTVTYEGKLSNGSYTQNTGARIMYGYVKNYSDKIITVTTQNLPDKGYDYTRDGDGKTATESYVLVTTDVTYLNLNEEINPVRASAESVIRDYTNYSECSRAIIITNYGSVKGCIIINGELD